MSQLLITRHISIKVFDQAFRRHKIKKYGEVVVLILEKIIPCDFYFN